MHKNRATAPQAQKKKSRSQSLGPGGVEALKDDSGNATKVLSPTSFGKLLLILWSDRCNVSDQVHIDAFYPPDATQSHTSL